jgi:hypothetical protein
MLEIQLAFRALSLLEIIEEVIMAAITDIIAKQTNISTKVKPFRDTECPLCLNITDEVKTGITLHRMALPLLPWILPAVLGQHFAED